MQVNTNYFKTFSFSFFQPLSSIGGVRDIGPGPEHDQYLWGKVSFFFVRYIVSSMLFEFCVIFYTH